MFTQSIQSLKTIVIIFRLKALEMEPYTQKEAEAAAGIGNYVPPKKRKIETQNVKE